MASIILASQSPRRKQLLESVGVDFETITQDTDESFPPDMNLTDVATFIALKKADAVKVHINKNLPIKYRELPIVAADTIVILENKAFGKPIDRDHAIETLLRLQNKEHQVITGVAILYEDKEVLFSETTLVVFHPLTRGQIEYYVDTYKPYDKAGAYAIQEWIGLVGLKEIHGDYYNIIGLPISRLLIELQGLNIL